MHLHKKIFLPGQGILNGWSVRPAIKKDLPIVARWIANLSRSENKFKSEKRSYTEVKKSLIGNYEELKAVFDFQIGLFHNKPMFYVEGHRIGIKSDPQKPMDFHRGYELFLTVNSAKEDYPAFLLASWSVAVLYFFSLPEIKWIKVTDDGNDPVREGLLCKLGFKPEKFENDPETDTKLYVCELASFPFPHG
jgi:hypothetical protein